MLVCKKSLAFLGLVIGITALFFALPTSAASYRLDTTGGDCPSIGTWDQNSLTCTLNQDLFQGIEIVENGITLQGAGHTVSGAGAGIGILLTNSETYIPPAQMTVRNITVELFSTGISVLQAPFTHSLVLDNITARLNSVGILFIGTPLEATIVQNSLIANNSTGIRWGYGGRVSLFHNQFLDNTYHLDLLTIDVAVPNQIDPSNTLDGKPVYYLVGASNQVLDASSNAGLVFCQNCSNMVIKDLVLSRGKPAVYLYDSSSSIIENLTVTDSDQGIIVSGSSYLTPHLDNVVRSNRVTNSGAFAIASTVGNRTTISGNTIDGCLGVGINLIGNDHRVEHNDVSHCHEGIYLGGENSLVTDNIFSQNNYNLSWGGSFSVPNQIYHNNIENPLIQQVFVTSGSTHLFSLDPPIGGNYWSDFANCLDADNDFICDARYEFFHGRDFYPWKVRDGWKIKAQKDPVILIPGILGSWQVKGVWYLDPILHTYDDVWTALQNTGYEVGKTLFAFPYQWRQDNVLSGLELKNKIEEVKNICECSKVDLVVHSMGGLVARSYIQGVDYANDVDQVIFLGVPQRGSPRSYLQWEAGEGFERNPYGLLKKAIFQFEAFKYGYFSLVNYIRDRIVSVEQLLPIDDYLRDDATGSLKPYPTDYPRNAFLENLNVEAALNLLESRARLTNIIGDAGDQSTINFIRVVPDPETGDNKWVHGFPEDFGNESTDQGLEPGPGDDTVPTASQRGLGDDIQNIVVASEHRSLPTNSQQDIIEELTGVRPAEFIRAPTIQKILFITIKSPADIQIIDPLGNRVGKDFVSGDFLTEAPLSFYSGSDTDLEFITIPNPSEGEYRVALEGTGIGPYTVESSIIDDQGIQTTSFSGFIDTSVQEELNVEYDAEQNTIGAPEPQDTFPPTITITSPEAGRIYTHQDSIVVQYSVMDDTGVQSSKASFTSVPREVQNGESIDLFLESIGTHSLTVEATDFLNNSSQIAVSFEIGATFESMIRDIERAHGLGWIKGKKIKNALIVQVKMIQKIKRPSAREKILQAFPIELQILHSKGLINDQAYELLKGDVEYLVDHT